MGWKTEDLVRGIPPGWVTRTQRLILMNMARYVTDKAAVKVCFAGQGNVALASGFKSATQMRDDWNEFEESGWFSEAKGQTKDTATGKFSPKSWVLHFPTDDEWESGLITVQPTRSALAARARALRINRNRDTTVVTRTVTPGWSPPVTPRWSPPRHLGGFTKEREKDLESWSTTTSPERNDPKTCQHLAKDTEGWCAGCSTQVPQ